MYSITRTIPVHSPVADAGQTYTLEHSIPTRDEALARMRYFAQDFAYSTLSLKRS